MGDSRKNVSRLLSNKAAAARSSTEAKGKTAMFKNTSHGDGREHWTNVAGSVGAATELLNAVRHNPARRHSKLQGSGVTIGAMTGTTTTTHQALPKAGHGARARYSTCTRFIDWSNFSWGAQASER